MKRFEKNLGPITIEEQEKLNKSKIFIAGCGGIGGYLLEHMTRVGVGQIVCADKDVFDESNLNRQLLATEETIGQKKALCAEKRVQKIWTNCNISGLDIEMNNENLPELIKDADLVLDALDNGNTRKMLMYACRKAGVVLAHAAASGSRVQAAIVQPGKELYEMLYTSGQRQKDGVLPFTAATAASLQAGLAVKYLAKGCWDDALFVLDLFTMEMDTIWF